MSLIARLDLGGDANAGLKTIAGMPGIVRNARLQQEAAAGPAIRLSPLMTAGSPAILFSQDAESTERIGNQKACL